MKIYRRALILVLVGSARVLASDLNVTGNLTVTGTVDSDGNTTSFGAKSASAPTQPGVIFTYTDNSVPAGSVDSFQFLINRNPASWLWLHNTPTTGTYSAMRLDSAHQLSLFRSDGTTAGLTFIPQTGAIKFGTNAAATFTANDTTGAITAGGALTVTSGITNTSGSFTGGTTGLTFTAGGTNQNITLTPSGTGYTLLNGSVGIGTTTPAAKLDVSGNMILGTVASGSSLTLRSYSDGRNWGIRDDAGVNRLRFYRGGSDQVFWDVLKTTSSDAIAGQIWYSNGAERLRLDSSGSLGIGTASPASRLHIYQTSGGANQLTLDTSFANGNAFAINPFVTGVSNGGFEIRDVTAGVPRLVVQQGTGNVGFGTATPVSKLQLTGDNVELAMGRANVDGTPYTRFGMTTGYDTYWASNATYATGAWNYVSTGGWGSQATRIDQINGTIQFDTANGGVNPLVWNNRLYISNAGSVGIGTTTPSRQLHVFGAGQASPYGLSDSGNKGGIILVQDSLGAPFNGGGIIFGAGSGYFAGIKSWVTDGNANTVGDLSFETRNLTSDTNLTPRLVIKSSGNIGIGTTNPGTYKLAVLGSIHATSVVVETGWSDYVFDSDYRLAPLSEVEAHIKEHKHLPGIPSAAEVAEHGVSLGDMQSKLLAKIEELTLRQIAQEKQLNAQASRIAQLEQENHALRSNQP